jgi:predicted RNase H-like nuclease (RuvC/YqgF family)
LPLLYQKYIVPVEQNMAEVTELQAWQKQTDQDLADLQSRLEAMETEQGQNAEALTELDERTRGIETEIAAHTKSLAALERMQTELEEQDEAHSAELERQISMLKAMELLSRARLFMFQSNFGLARQDVKIARDLLMVTRRDAAESFADDLDEVIRRLDQVLLDLPNFPVAARDDIDVAWQVLLLGLPQAQIEADGTSVPTITPFPTPTATFTPTPGVTLEPTAID